VWCGGGGVPGLDPRVFGEKPIKQDSSSQCPPLDNDDKGIWVYVAESATDCFFGLVVESRPSPTRFSADRDSWNGRLTPLGRPHIGTLARNQRQMSASRFYPQSWRFHPKT
jgi:hypothetical protein